MKKPSKISKSDIIKFLIRLYTLFPPDSEARKEIKSFVTKLYEEDY